MTFSTSSPDASSDTSFDSASEFRPKGSPRRLSEPAERATRLQSGLQSRWARRAALVGMVAGALSLAGCYVVPIQPPHSPYSQPGQHAPTVYVPSAPPAAPAPATFAARLYPSNDLAASYGMVMAVVTNDLNGRGTFSANINGENFTGEATRAVGSGGSAREGQANGTGSRGSYINCRYQMNSTTLGSGQCRLSNGAQFSMHVGS